MKIKVGGTLVLVAALIAAWQIAGGGGGSLTACSESVTYHYCVTTNGSNTNPGTREEPFLTFDKAYDTASAGDTVQVAEGNYGTQTITGTKAGTDDITFEARGDVRVPGQLDINGPDSITLDGLYVRDLDISATDITFTNFEHNSGTFTASKQISFIDGEVHKSSTISGRDDSMFFGGSHTQNQDVLLDNVYFHDVERPASNPDGHTDCLQVTGVDGLIVRNSKFLRCDDASIIAKADQGQLLDMTIENNWFDKGLCLGELPNTELDGGSCDPSNFEVGLAGNFHPDTCTGVIRFNSINDKQRSMNCVPPSDGDFDYHGNIVLSMTDTSCSDTDANVDMDRNLFTVDDASNSPCGTNALVDDPEWVDGTQSLLTMDLSLAATSPTIDWATGVACPATDSAGVKRPQGAACDAGAMERVP